MKVTYDPDRDDLRILFSDAPIERSTNEADGLILDYGDNGAVVGLEVTEASRRLLNPRSVEFAEVYFAEVCAAADPTGCGMG